MNLMGNAKDLGVTKISQGVDFFLHILTVVYHLNGLCDKQISDDFLARYIRRS